MPGKQRAAFVIVAAALIPVLAAHAQQKLGDGHIAIDKPAELSVEEANRIYRDLMEAMADGYGISRLPLVDGYQTWARYNSAPYLSATHGRRFVNNYANETGRAYGSLKRGDKLPVGTVLAKDSMTVTEEGRFFPAALFIMEKLASGASPETADWRYVVVNPDGSMTGDTIGDGAELVQYCHDCHAAKADLDYVFLVPKKFRKAE